MSTKNKIILMIVFGLILLEVGVFSSVVLFQRVQADLVPTEDQEIAPKKAEVVVPEETPICNMILARDEAVEVIVAANLIEGQTLLVNDQANRSVPSESMDDIPLCHSHPGVLMFFVNPTGTHLAAESTMRKPGVRR